MENFIDKESGSFVEMPLSFTYEKSMLQEYSYQRGCTDLFTYYPTKIPNATVITAQLSLSDQNGKCCIKYHRERVEARNTYFLSELMNLRLNLSKELFDELADIEQLLLIDRMPTNPNLHRIMFKSINTKSLEPTEISDKDLNLITQWCKKNGYPFSIKNKIDTLNIIKTTVDKDDNVIYTLKKRLIPPNVDVSFWVWEFLRKLQILYITLLLFYRINNYDLQDIQITDTQFENYTNKQCEQLLQRIYETINLKGLLDFQQYKNRKKGMLMGYATANAFDLSIYSLFVFMSMFGKTLKRCPMCQKLFSPKHGRQKYCNTRPCEVGRCKDDRRPDCLKYCNSKTCYPQLSDKRKQSIKKKSKEQPN